MRFAVSWLGRKAIIGDPTPVAPNRHFDITAAFAEGAAQLGPADLPESVIDRYRPPYAPLRVERLGADRQGFVANLLAELLTPRTVTSPHMADHAVPPELPAALTREPDTPRCPAGVASAIPASRSLLSAARRH